MALNNMGLGLQFTANDQTGPGMASAQTNLAKTKKAAEDASLSMKQIGQGLERVSAGAAIAGAALTASLGLAVGAAAKFQYGVASVATEADAAKLPASAIADIAKKMSTTYGGELDTQIKAAYQGVAAGADTAAKSMQLLDAANKLAIAGQTDQATAILGLTKVLNNYNMDFSQATDVADAFFVAVRGGQTTVGELGNAIGEVASLGKSAGISMTELIGALGTAATLGKDTATSTAELKAALSGIAHPTADAAAEAQRLGIHFNSVELRSKGLVGFLQEITSSSKFTSDSFNKLFGSMEASAFMTSLTANNMSALKDMMQGMKDRAGGSQKAFETMSATLQQSASILKANLEVALVNVGNAFLPLITTVVQFTTRVIQGFNNLPDSVKKGVAIFLTFAAVALTVAGVVGGLVGALLTTELPLAAIGIGLAAMAGVIAPLIVLGGGLAAVIIAVRRAFDENIGGLRTTVIPMLEKIKLTWDALVQAFTDGGFSGSVREQLNNGNQSIKNFVVNVFVFASRIKNFFESIGKGFERASDMAGPTFAKLSIALERLGQALGKLFGGKQDPDKAAASFDRFGDAGERVGATIEKIAEIVVSGFTIAVEWITGFVSMISEVAPAFGFVWDQVKVLFGALGDLFTALGGITAAFGATKDTTEQSGGAFAVVIGLIAETLGILIRTAAFIISVFVPVIRSIVDVAVMVGQVFRFVFGQIETQILNVVRLIAMAIDAAGKLAGKDFGLTKGIDKALGGSSAAPGSPTGSASWLAPAASVQPGTRATTAAPMNPFIGMTTGTTPLATTTTTAPPSANALTVTSSPAIASAQGQGPAPAPLTAEQVEQSMGRALKTNAAGPPQQIIVPVMLDGQKIAEATANATQQQQTRSFQPTPLPSG